MKHQTGYAVEIKTEKLERRLYSRYQDDYYRKHADFNESIFHIHLDAPEMKTRSQFLKLKSTEKSMLQELQGMGVHVREETHYSPRDQTIVLSLHHDKKEAYQVINDLWQKGLDAGLSTNTSHIRQAEMKLKGKKQNQKYSIEMER